MENAHSRDASLASSSPFCYYFNMLVVLCDMGTHIH